MRRILFWMAIIACAGIAGVLGVAYLNVAVALDDAYQQVRDQRQTAETLRAILEDVSRHVDRATVTSLVERRANSSRVLKREAETLSLDEIVFVFEGDKVSAVRLLGATGSPRESR